MSGEVARPEAARIAAVVVSQATLVMDDVGANFTAALEMFRAGRIDDAEAACREVVADEPACAAAHHLLAAVELQRGDPAAALGSAQRAVHIDPNHWTFHNTLGCALSELEKPRKAIASFRRGLQIAPKTAELYNNLARAQCELGENRDAEISYRKALRLDPAYAEAMYNLANFCRDGGRFDEAVALYDAALRQQGDVPLARRNRGLALLEMGRFTEGWTEYDERWTAQQKTRPGSSLDAPPWEGQPLGGRTILIHAEQGVGDEIMFASCYPQMIARAGRCVLTCDPRLEAIFGRSFPTAIVSTTTQGNERNRQPPQGMTFDFQVTAGDLPRYLRPAAECFPRQRRFLSADRDRRASWRQRLHGLGDGLNVGISWLAGATREERRNRSIPLDLWASLLATPGVNFISLQYGPCQEQLERFMADTGAAIHTFSDFDPTNDLDQLAALISSLDLVISVGNTTVHLAGSLGTPTWTMLPSAGAWPWTQGRDNALWYESVCLLRASASDDWAGLVERVRCDLVRMTGQQIERKSEGETGRAPHFRRGAPLAGLAPIGGAP